MMTRKCSAVKKRAKFTCFGRKERPIFSSDNRYFMDLIET